MRFPRSYGSVMRRSVSFTMRFGNAISMVELEICGEGRRKKTTEGKKK